MRRSRLRLPRLAFGAAASILVFGSGQALAQAMPVGAPTAAPAGFLDFCNRNPRDCQEPTRSVDDTREQAQRLFWASVFTDADPEPAAVTRPSGTARASDRRPPRIAEHAIAMGRSAPAASDREPRALYAHPGFTADAAKAVGRAALSLSAVDLARIDAINRGFNRSIRQSPDRRQYGVGDYWTIPEGRAPRGDCEDFVLAKRRALVASGYSPTLLSIALVITPWGEDHAVLLVSTTDGELVLDNLTPRIERWDRTGYRWLKRQTPGHALAWSAIG